MMFVVVGTIVMPAFFVPLVFIMFLVRRFVRNG